MLLKIGQNFTVLNILHHEKVCNGAVIKYTDSTFKNNFSFYSGTDTKAIKIMKFIFKTG